MTIRQARINKNWTQIQLAAAAKVSPPVISRMENGQAVQASSLLLVCQALGVRESEIEGVNIVRKLRA